MIKSSILTVLLLTAQLSFCQIDTTTFKYPRIAQQGDVTEDLIVQFSPLQAKLAAIDGINADSYKEELDSCKSLVNSQIRLIGNKNGEISLLEYKVKTKDRDIDSWTKESGRYKELYTKESRKAKVAGLFNKILIPTFGGIIIAETALLVFIFAVK